MSNPLPLSLEMILPALSVAESAEELEKIQQRVFETLGLMIPLPQVRQEAALANDTYQIQINTLRLPVQKGTVQDAYASLEQETLAHAAELLTGTTVEDQLGLLANTHEVLIDCVTARFKIDHLTNILQELLSEGISIRDLPAILEGLLATNTTTCRNTSQFIVFTPSTGVTGYTLKQNAFELDIREYAATLRTHLKTQISRQYVPLDQSMNCYLLDPNTIEVPLQEPDSRAWEAANAVALRAAIAGELEYGAPKPAILLTTIEVRRKLWELIHGEFPQVVVLCYQELSPDLNISVVARITLETD